MKRHNTSTVLLSRLMSIYTNIHQLGLVGIEKIMIMLTRNDYEPDICFSRKKNQIVLWKIKRYFPLLILSLKYFRKVQKSGIGERPFGAWNFRIIRLTKLKNIVLFTPNTKPLSNIILKRMVMN